MSALTARHVWTYRFLYFVLGLVLITLKLLPLNLAAGGIPGPDLLVLVTFAWLVRQPNVVPLGLVLILFLLADFLFQRPPGLWTLLVILACESLRRRRLTMTEFPFLVEWGAAAMAIIGMVLLNRLVLWVLLVDLDPLGLTLAHGLVTIVFYPVVVGISKYIFGLRKLGPAELESF
ncbi:rod shape-determining protein MreD [Hasllibacter sp. MH4015]|uniref:rod shape-determining protein MreD n=1 Tax=Hasllibacter sp. MH4015 TaxID=2854029 RepID=UPI001CD5D9C3|nr:rod shape-determining protein MreD [Hasllibacter sp. MH4015]